MHREPCVQVCQMCQSAKYMVSWQCVAEAHANVKQLLVVLLSIARAHLSLTQLHNERERRLTREGNNSESPPFLPEALVASHVPLDLRNEARKEHEFQTCDEVGLFHANLVSNST